MHYIHSQTASKIDLYILETHATIDAEAEAMLQALHSRSVGGIKSHLQILEKRGAANFMSQFYVGYGHKSIGDCGSLTIFVEGCSMLAAKAIQDTKLYNGQEASTRYIDFSQQPIINPLGHTQANDILEEQRQRYLGLIPTLVQSLQEQYPLIDPTQEKVYMKTIKAKAFDIARGFLPAGCSTNLARHTNLRQVADRILRLRHHPLQEVQEIANGLLDLAIQKYPNSFSKKTYEESEIFYEKAMQSYYFHDTSCPRIACIDNSIQKEQLDTYRDLINARPNGKTELPAFLDTIGTLSFRYIIDFGSFRDIQRHRAPSQRMPLLTSDIGFHPWYLNSIAQTKEKGTQAYLTQLFKKIDTITKDPLIKQYYLPMGCMMSCEFIGTLPALIYMAELRSTTYVHPTIRPIAHTIGDYIESNFAIKMFVDRSADEFDLRRGTHDIEKS